MSAQCAVCGASATVIDVLPDLSSRNLCMACAQDAHATEAGAEAPALPEPRRCPNPE